MAVSFRGRLLARGVGRGTREICRETGASVGVEDKKRILRGVQDVCSRSRGSRRNSAGLTVSTCGVEYLSRLGANPRVPGRPSGPGREGSQ